MTTTTTTMATVKLLEGRGADRPAVSPTSAVTVAKDRGGQGYLLKEQGRTKRSRYCVLHGSERRFSNSDGENALHALEARTDLKSKPFNKLVQGRLPTRSWFSILFLANTKFENPFKKYFRPSPKL